MKFLVDVGVGRIAEEALLRLGFDFQAVRDIDPRMEDSHILQIASDERRIVITMDKDFGELVYRVNKTHAGVLLLRLEDASGVEKARVLEKILTQHGDKLSGHFCVYQNGRLRIR